MHNAHICDIPGNVCSVGEPSVRNINVNSSSTLVPYLNRIMKRA